MKFWTIFVIVGILALSFAVGQNLAWHPIKDVMKGDLTSVDLKGRSGVIDESDRAYALRNPKTGWRYTYGDILAARSGSLFVYDLTNLISWGWRNTKKDPLMIGDKWFSADISSKIQSGHIARYAIIGVDRMYEEPTQRVGSKDWPCSNRFYSHRSGTRCDINSTMKFRKPSSNEMIYTIPGFRYNGQESDKCSTCSEGIMFVPVNESGHYEYWVHEDLKEAGGWDIHLVGYIR